jgi:hypothetical protein
MERGNKDKASLASQGKPYNPMTCRAFKEFYRRYRQNVEMIGTNDRRAPYAPQNAKANMGYMEEIAGLDEGQIVISRDDDNQWHIEINGQAATEAPKEPAVVRSSEVGSAIEEAVFGGLEHLKSKDMTQARAILTMYEGGIEGSDLAKSLGVKCVTQSLIARSLGVTPGYVSNVIREERVKRDTPTPSVDTEAVFSAIDGLV